MHYSADTYNRDVQERRFFQMHFSLGISRLGSPARRELTRTADGSKSRRELVHGSCLRLSRNPRKYFHAGVGYYYVKKRRPLISENLRCYILFLFYLHECIILFTVYLKFPYFNVL